MNIIYLRVSTNEKRQDLDQQLKAILDRHKFEDYKVFRDKGSAYQMDKLNKRTGFLEVFKILFYTNKTIYECFIKYRFDKEQIYLHVWDLSRIFRNLEKNLQFYLFCKQFKIRIVSYKDNKVYCEKDYDNPNDEMLEILTFFLDSYTAQKHSWDTSINIKRGYDAIKGGTSKGMIWGLGMKTSLGWDNFWSESIKNNKDEVIERLSECGRLRMTVDEKKAFDNYIKKLIKQGYMRVDIIKMVEQTKGIIINHKYLSVNFRGIN